MGRAKESLNSGGQMTKDSVRKFTACTQHDLNSVGWP